MTWARIAVALGALLTMAAFGIGTEATAPAVTIDGSPYGCGARVIPTDWLVSGTGSSRTRPGSGSARLDARIDAACGPRDAVLHGVVVGSLVVGGIALLIGWAALRESESGLASAVAH